MRAIFDKRPVQGGITCGAATCLNLKVWFSFLVRKLKAHTNRKTCLRRRARRNKVFYSDKAERWRLLVYSIFLLGNRVNMHFDLSVYMQKVFSIDFQFLAMVINITRLYYDVWSGYWSETLLMVPSLLILPLVPFAVPFTWVLLNWVGTASILSISNHVQNRQVRHKQHCSMCLSIFMGRLTTKLFKKKKS